MDAEKRMGEYDRIKLIEQLKAMKDAGLGYGEAHEKIDEVISYLIEHAVWDKELKLDQTIEELQAAIRGENYEKDRVSTDNSNVQTA